jgi:hypothetical protein
MMTRVAIESDLDAILRLQSLNLYTNLSPAERADGFVTTPFTSEQIRQLLSQTGAFVAEEQGKIVGYLLVGTWEYYSQWPIFPYMVSRFPQLEFQGTPITTQNTFQYGPVCIDRALRGAGRLLPLFEAMRSSFATRFPIGLTFINQANPRSLVAHQRKLDLEIYNVPRKLDRGIR